MLLFATLFFRSPLVAAISASDAAQAIPFAQNWANASLIAGGRVMVPAMTWKVIIVLPVGTDDVNRVGKTTRTIAVIMPNNQSIGINTPWRNFRTSLDRVEGLTGYDFFSNVRPQIQNLIEKQIDLR